jgi:protein-L-isoaspartate(D-aspartate) O-methyltransferase
MTPAELAIVRRAYARQTLAAADITDSRTEAAFAEVPREDFLGPGPWQMLRMLRGYTVTPDADPVYLYVDQVVGLIPERHINNGQPSMHARLISGARIGPGEHVAHIGAGTGYFTAIMAHLAGPSGKVTAIEINAALAARARESLASRTNVTLVEGDGATAPVDAADVIYVNAGVTHPVDLWLDTLREGGRLILPLTSDMSLGAAGSTAPEPMSLARSLRKGAYFQIERRGTTFEAHGLSPVMIVAAEGPARDKDSEAPLAAALEKGGWMRVSRLLRGAASEGVPDEQCWLRGRDWCLAY